MNQDEKHEAIGSESSDRLGTVGDALVNAKREKHGKSKCPICNESGGPMINYGRMSAFMMHSECAARHFQKALRNISKGVFPGCEYRNGVEQYVDEVLEGKHLPRHEEPDYCDYGMEQHYEGGW